MKLAITGSTGNMGQAVMKQLCSLENIEKIKSALIAMLETMPIDEISATMLCQQAEVNRATFYYHYNSIQDVLTDIEAQVEREFLHFLAQSTVDSNGAPAKPTLPLNSRWKVLWAWLKRQCNYELNKDIPLNILPARLRPSLIGRCGYGFGGKCYMDF